MFEILVAALRGASAAASAALARRRDIEALRAMDAHELADLGIAWSQIEDYVDGKVALAQPSRPESHAGADAARRPARARLKLVHSA